MPYQFKKHFKVEEARALLPRLRRAFTTIHTARDRLLETERHLAATLEKTGGDLGGDRVATMARAMIAIHEGLNDITSRGIQIKDVDRGLVDFPHLRNGHEVFLCWELEDDDIEFWHDLDSGYPGRERL
ncbi:MAG: DUF2203 domain-containing protein [Verrucomicrobia bacterium]|nr:DUF2203 domain-containing protein [Verrucomicrobiota bacterium]